MPQDAQRQQDIDAIIDSLVKAEAWERAVAALIVRNINRRAAAAGDPPLVRVHLDVDGGPLYSWND